MRIILFNIFIVFFLLLSIAFPLIFLDKSPLTVFWRSIWPLELVVVLVVGGMNIFFLVNRRLFMLLEREDWPALSAFLTQKVYQEERYSPRYVRLLAQSCLVLGNYEDAKRLKDKLAEVKPALLEENALALGVAYLLCGDSAGAAEFFEARPRKKNRNDAWVRWYYGYSLRLAGSPAQAGVIFEELLSSHDVVVTGLSAFSLSRLPGTQWSVPAETGKARARKALTVQKWKQKTKKLENEVQGALITHYLDKAGAWIYGSIIT